MRHCICVYCSYSVIFRLDCIVPPVIYRVNAALKVVIGGISWKQQSFINYYNPELENLNVFDKSDDKHGPIAGGTEIVVCQYLVSLYRGVTFLSASHITSITFIMLANVKAVHECC